ncbi:uncharacterized protein LOC18441257 [Amborella trichopoda]|uniref:Condensation domain-containing protein n=1 Tax=Amborella trichopoda TaxID=13333 RepID=W1PZK0_AMBTC|nr:uncharacterized protein LOC18441257 [Amborella trichopoda]ERN13020.1 hypothetical protein AMTR_s00040p00100620 [Amborella trichopoda]|eukprot:XP_006851439.1 uncharacterized protein LOC18441257 [Amborella trichopoda]
MNPESEQIHHENSTPEETLTHSRFTGGTENSWCRAVMGGTGITVLSLLLSKPMDPTIIQETLQTIMTQSPLLRHKLVWESNSKNPSFSLSSNPSPNFEIIDTSPTLKLLGVLSDQTHLGNFIGDAFHCLLEHELNRNSWCDGLNEKPMNMFFVTLYFLGGSHSILSLRLHTAICDRASAVCILRKILRLVYERESGVIGASETGDVVHEGIEDLIPKGKADKPFWAHGIDLLGYSLGSKRLTNIQFQETKLPRSSQMIRLQMGYEETGRLLAECRRKGVKLCGAIAAAGLMAVSLSKQLHNQCENYAIVTLIDCRKMLEPALHDDNLGFYHSAIMNTISINGEEDLWQLANRFKEALNGTISRNKHFTDMSDVNYLMCKAISCPAFTPYSSLRTSFMVVFEDTLMDDTQDLQEELGVLDYVGCSSVHGVGPSIAVFDTVRNGQLDCACVYPSPLHSRKQMHGLIENMKNILTGASG